MIPAGPPRVLKGALVAIDYLSLRPVDIIPFQYNPHTLSRSFELKTGVSGVEAGQLSGAPAETISVELELDASDELERGEGQNGVAHRLAALQDAVSPTAVHVLANLVLTNIGTIEIAPPTTKLTLFIWGPKRVLPIVVTELSFTEERHDIDLTPLAARVSLGMRVLNWDDVGQFHPAFGIALAHKMRSEVLAAMARVRQLASVMRSSTLSL